MSWSVLANSFAKTSMLQLQRMEISDCAALARHLCQVIHMLIAKHMLIGVDVGSFGNGAKRHQHHFRKNINLVPFIQSACLSFNNNVN